MSDYCVEVKQTLNIINERLKIDEKYPAAFDVVRHIVDKALLISWSSVSRHVSMLDWMMCNQDLIALVMHRQSVTEVQAGARHEHGTFLTRKHVWPLGICLFLHRVLKCLHDL